MSVRGKLFLDVKDFFCIFASEKCKMIANISNKDIIDYAEV